MNNIRHPDAEDIIAYLENPQAEVFTDICLHLAHCEDCRHQAENLSDIEKTIKREGAALFRHGVNSNPELKQAEAQHQIEGFVDQQLEGEAKSAVESLIAREPQALKAALHYASHSAAMERELEQQTSTPQLRQSTEPSRSQTGTAVTTGWQERIRHWLNPSVWVAVPVTALATAVLVINLAPLLNATGNMTVASYQDNPVIQFHDKDQLPGIGFFTDAFNVIKPFNKVEVSIVDTDSIHFLWPAVDKAISYTFKLQVIDNGQKVIVAEKTTPKNSIDISGLDTRVDHRYEWILSGKTNDAQKFYTMGGFVINHQESSNR